MPGDYRPSFLEVYVSENWVSDIVRKVVWKHGVNRRHRWRRASPKSGEASPSTVWDLEKFQRFPGRLETRGKPATPLEAKPPQTLGRLASNGAPGFVPLVQ